MGSQRGGAVRAWGHLTCTGTASLSHLMCPPPPRCRLSLPLQPGGLTPCLTPCPREAEPSPFTGSLLTPVPSPNPPPLAGHSPRESPGREGRGSALPTQAMGRARASPSPSPTAWQPPPPHSPLWLPLSLCSLSLTPRFAHSPPWATLSPGSPRLPASPSRRLEEAGRVLAWSLQKG